MDTSPSPALTALLARPAVLLSGACGTELERRGAATPLPLWSAAAIEDEPDLVRAIHREYVEAGASVVTANTFRTDRRTLSKVGRGHEARDLTRAAVMLAREAIESASPPPSRPVVVAGSVSPLEDCYRPDLVPDDETLAVEHAAKAEHLVAAGVDLVLVETMNSVREALAALRACREAALPAAVSLVCGPGARLLSGERVADAVRALAPLAPLAICVNCCHPEVANEALAVVVREAGGIPAGVYANGVGGPDSRRGWTFEGARGADLATFLSEARKALDLGARWIGGCCGTRPAHVAALRGILTERGL